MKNQTTREAWLEKAVIKLQDKVFKHSIPKVKVSIGFPGGRDPKKAIGQHWHPDASKDGISQIFISPTHENSIDHLATLAHELVHACVPDAKHGKPFRKIAKEIGLDGPMRATTAGKELTAKLKKIISDIGEIPHATIMLTNREKKQTTRLIKIACADCGYVCRTTRQWIDAIGAPLCPCNNEPMQL